MQLAVEQEEITSQDDAFNGLPDDIHIPQYLSYILSTKTNIFIISDGTEEILDMVKGSLNRIQISGKSEWNDLTLIPSNVELIILCCNQPATIIFDKIQLLKSKTQATITTFFDLVRNYYIFKSTFKNFPHYHPIKDIFSYWVGSKQYNHDALYEDIQGKTVLELGPLDGSMTGSILSNNPKKLISVDIGWENFHKLNAGKLAFNHDNLEIVIDDFHNVTPEKYPNIDILYAHGVLYHSSNPATILEALTKIAPKIVIGAHTRPKSKAKTKQKDIEWRCDKYPARIANERFTALGGPGSEQTFIPPEMYLDILDKCGFCVQEIDRIQTRSGQLFYQLIGSQRDS